MLPCYKPGSHLQTDWVTNQHSRGSALQSCSYQMCHKHQKPVRIFKVCMLHTAKPCALWLCKPELYGDNSDYGWVLII